MRRTGLVAQDLTMETIIKLILALMAAILVLALMFEIPLSSFCFFFEGVNDFIGGVGGLVTNITCPDRIRNLGTLGEEIGKLASGVIG